MLNVNKGFLTKVLRYFLYCFTMTESISMSLHFSQHRYQFVSTSNNYSRAFLY